MSFGKTKSPLFAELRKEKQRYFLPTNGKGKICLTPELEDEFRRLFPKEHNRVIMELFGISFATLQRFKRELGLSKDMDVIRHKQALITKRICEKNGWYDSLRGKVPSEATRAATRRYRATHPHPKHILKEQNPRKYRAMLRRQSKQRKELLDREKKRYNLGLLPLSDLPTHFYAGITYDSYQIHVRSRCKRWGIY